LDRAALLSIAPVDGRYAQQCQPLQAYFSEYGLMKYRLRVELRWLLFMSQQDAITHVRRISAQEERSLLAIEREFDTRAALRVKEIERHCRHDVKAIELYLRECLQGGNMQDLLPSLHFACTSDDINNLAYAMMIRDALQGLWLPLARSLLQELQDVAQATATVPMLARTHGQPASPTTVGKELAVFYWRMRRQLRAIAAQDYLGKFNGAVGAYNAHRFAYPSLDWLTLSRHFVESLGLQFNPLSTQIEPHDYLAELAHGLMRLHVVLLDFCRDMWGYISLGYFKQRVIASEVGSSTMPHKVNPIDFENAEANAGISNASLAHLAGKLPISRYQRDLSDSAAMRTVGTAIAHSTLALQSARRGLRKARLDTAAIAADLDDAWEVLGEAVQTILRAQGMPDAYEQLKQVTRGTAVTKEQLQSYIRSLSLPDAEQQRLLQLRPETYLGYAVELAQLVADKNE